MRTRTEDLIKSVPLGVFKSLTSTGRAFKRSTNKDYRKKETASLDPDSLADEGLEDLSWLRKAFQGRDAYSSYGEVDHQEVMRQLVTEYRKQLVEASDFIEARKEEVPQELKDAIKHLGDRIAHWVGSSGKP